MINYPGNPAGFNPAVGFSVDEPQDVIDPLNAATVNSAFEDLTDAVEYIRTEAGFIAQAETVDGGWEFVGGTTDSDYSMALNGAATTFRRQLALDGNGFPGSIYQDVNGNMRIVSNATWDDVGLVWHQVDAGQKSYFVSIGAGGLVTGYKAIGAPDWVDGAWSVGISNVDADLGAYGLIVSSGPLGGITSTTGDINATNGNITAAAGNIAATLGNVTAGAAVSATTGMSTVSGDCEALNGVGRFSRVEVPGTALVGGDFALNANWDTSTITTLTGRDQAFTVEITAAGAGLAANPIWELAFSDGDFANGFHAMVALSGSSDGTAPIGAGCNWLHVAGPPNKLSVQLLHTPLAGSTYTFTAIVIGY